jgi:iron(III) transport system permease protein
LGLLTFALLAIVVLPLLLMIVAAFRPLGTLPLDPGPFDASAFERGFSQAGMGEVLLNTAVFAGGSVMLALPIAIVLAFLTERTDLPFRNAIYVAMFVPMTIPVFATALGWILLLGPRAGILNVGLNELLGRESTDGLLNIYSMRGMIFLQALGLVPSMWLLLTAVLRNMNPVLEEAASTSGAGRISTFKKVTLPLMRPAIAAVLIYYLVQGIEILELPLAVGPNAGVEVLSTRIFFEVMPVGAEPPDYPVAAAIGMLALALGVIGIVIYSYLMRRASSFAVVSGKAYRPQRIRLGRWKWPALLFVFGYMLLKVILPLGVLLYASFLRFYQPPRVGDLPWTLDNYVRLLDYRHFGRYFVNTILVSFGAAALTMLLAGLVSWFVVRYPSKLTKLLNFFAFMPLAIPGVISTLAFFLIFIGTPLYGSLILMVLAFTSRYLAYGTRLMHAAQLQIHKELEEASLTSSVPPWRGYLSINLPLLKPAMINGFLWVLVHAARDFSVALLLATAGSLLAGNVIYSAFVGGSYPPLLP